jgi:hypothetical protein
MWAIVERRMLYVFDVLLVSVLLAAVWMRKDIEMFWFWQCKFYRALDLAIIGNWFCIVDSIVFFEGPLLTIAKVI